MCVEEEKAVEKEWGGFVVVVVLSSKIFQNHKMLYSFQREIFS